jgi:hypothetical protein
MRPASRFAAGAASACTLRVGRSAAMRACTSGRFAAAHGTCGSRSRSAIRGPAASAASTSSRRIASGPDPSRRSPIAPAAARGAPQNRGGKPTISFPSLMAVGSVVSRTTACCAGRVTSRSRWRGGRRKLSVRASKSPPTLLSPPHHIPRLRPAFRPTVAPVHRQAVACWTAVRLPTFDPHISSNAAVPTVRVLR